MRIVRGARAMALAGVLALGLAACGSDDEPDETSGETEAPEEGDFVTDLTFGTGGTTGVYFPLGSEYANLFEDNIEGVKVNAIETEASVANLGAIFQEEMQLGMTQNDTAIAAVNGEGDFEGAAVDNVGWLGKLYPEALHVLTLDDSIESIEDLKGKRVAIGAPGSGTRIVTETVLEASGLAEGDYEALDEDFDSSSKLLQDGNVDVAFAVVGTPSSLVTELAATNDVKLVPVEESVAEQIASDTDLEAYTTAADSYDFLEEDVSTVSAFSGIVASTSQVSPDLAYEITKVVYENAGDLTIPQGELIAVEEALIGQGDLPLHPGAEKYFKEQGLL